MKSFKTILITSFLIFLVSCEKKGNAPDDSFPAANQLVMFQVEYSNHAWGYSHSGIMIDSSGRTGYFNLPDIWHSPDSAGYISESAMNENVQHLDTFYYIPEKNTLLKNFNMLGNAAEGKLSDPFHTAYDAGEVMYSGYLFDSVGRKYKHVLIREEGDWSITNNAPGANQLYEWLRSVYLEVIKKAAGH